MSVSFHNAQNDMSFFFKIDNWPHTLTQDRTHRCATCDPAFMVNWRENEGQMETSVLGVFWELGHSNERYLHLSVWKDSSCLSLRNETANILVPSLPSNQTLLFLSFPCSMICLLLSACLTLLFQLSYSHLLIFTSFSLILSLTICCLPTPSQHISISLFSSITSSAMFSFNHPLKKYIHLRKLGSY